MPILPQVVITFAVFFMIYFFKKPNAIQFSARKQAFMFCILVSGITANSHRVFAQQTKWVAPETANSLKNPIAGNNASVLAGKAIYNRFCTPCHGYNGLGDGPVAGTLNPKPANHSSEGVQSQSDGALFWKISEGKGAMAAYKNPLTEQQRWSLVSYIRTLKSKPKE